MITEFFDQFAYSPSEDLAGDFKGHITIRNKNATNDWSYSKASEFDLSVTPIAEVPVAEIEALSDLNHDGKADNHQKFYVNKDVLLEFTVEAADLDGSEQLNSVFLSGLKDASGQMIGSIVDINGNPVGSLNSSGEVEFSEEDIEKFLTANSNHPLYFKPQQDFTGNVELTIHATSKDGEASSQVSSASTAFEIQDGDVALNYLSFSLSDNARSFSFSDEVTLKYEIDSGYSGLWREAAGKLLAEAIVSNSDILNIRLTGWNDEWFASETAFNAAVSSGQISVQTATGYSHGAPHSDWNWNHDSTIAVPSYTDIKAQVDSWLTSLTFEKDTITFEKGSVVGPEDNIVLSIVEGEEIPHDLRLRETNNDWGSSNQSYGNQELYFLGRELFVADDGEILGYSGNIFESGKLLTQSEKNYLSFSLSDNARSFSFSDEVTLKYEIDSGYSGLWRGRQAGKLLAEAIVSNSDILNIRLTGWNDEWFASETAFNAVSSGQISVQTATGYSHGAPHSD